MVTYLVHALSISLFLVSLFPLPFGFIFHFYFISSLLSPFPPFPFLFFPSPFAYVLLFYLHFLSPFISWLSLFHFPFLFLVSLSPSVLFLLPFAFPFSYFLPSFPFRFPSFCFPFPIPLISQTIIVFSFLVAHLRTLRHFTTPVVFYVCTIFIKLICLPHQRLYHLIYLSITWYLSLCHFWNLLAFMHLYLVSHLRISHELHSSVALLTEKVMRETEFSKTEYGSL